MENQETDKGMITQEQLTQVAKENQNHLIEMQGRSSKKGCFITKENQDALTEAIVKGDIKIGGLDKSEYSKKSEYFVVKNYEPVLKEGVSIMWAGNGDLYLNPAFDKIILPDENGNKVGESFMIPDNKTNGLTAEGKLLLESSGLSSYPVDEFRKMLPLVLLSGDNEVVCQAPSTWGEDTTQTAQKGAYINVTEDWQTGDITEVYIINPDSALNPIGFKPANGLDATSNIDACIEASKAMQTKQAEQPKTKHKAPK